MFRRAKCAGVGALVLALSLAARRACADGAVAPGTEASTADWSARYQGARGAMIEGRYRDAEMAFRQLADQAASPGDRLLCLEMARLSAEYAARAEQRPPLIVAAPVLEPKPRTTGEITLLYANALLYGVGSGAWFLLEVKPDSALTATLPFAALTAAPVVAVATVDGYRRLPRGVPQAMSSGLYLGLGEAVWVVGFQHNRADRIEGSSPGAHVRWSSETTAGVLWGGATLGATMGAVLGATLDTTPARIAFVASATLWPGTVVGLGAAAVLPDNGFRAERAFVAGGVAYNGGLVAGTLLAPRVAPSVARMRLVDLFGLGGGLLCAGAYLGIAHDVDIRWAEGLGAIGAGAGLVAGWLVTSGMAADASSGLLPTKLVPNVMPTAGGIGLGVGGML